ncbi:uncharacterized [Tachysurus ichikawai]
MPFSQQVAPRQVLISTPSSYADEKQRPAEWPKGYSMEVGPDPAHSPHFLGWTLGPSHKANKGCGCGGEACHWPRGGGLRLDCRLLPISQDSPQVLLMDLSSTSPAALTATGPGLEMISTQIREHHLEHKQHTHNANRTKMKHRKHL